MQDPTFQIIPLEERDDFATFEIEPLDRGYGHTIGNALRRVLLSSLSGYAVEEVKIKGVDHQFSTLKGMSEDVVDFLLNIKQIRISGKNQEGGTLRINVSSKTEVTGSDIECSDGLEIVNKNLHLATLEKGTSLEVEMKVGYGLGYSMAHERKNSTIGVMVVDALYSPVVKVSYDVEATRVGRRTDFDKLIMNIWTDGSISARTALDEAAKILVSQFTQVFNPIEVEQEVEKEKLSPEEMEILRLTVEELDLPTRIANALRKGGYKTVEDLVNADRANIAKVKNLGEKSVQLIQTAVEKKGVSLKG